MSYLRSISTRRLLLLSGGLLALLASAAAIAVAATSGGPTPPPKPLAEAVHDALAAPDVQGVTARITFTNRLIDASGLGERFGADPLLTGAKGRLWLSANGDVRLELQSGASAGGGDAQVILRGRRFTVFHAAANTVYRGTLPADSSADGATSDAHQPPTLAAVERALSRLAERADLSAATPTNVAGEPAYSVRLEPRRHGGLVGGAELAWDAANGVPLRAAVYARGNPDPVLELAATDVAFGPVDASVFDVAPPADAKVVELTPGADQRAPDAGGTDTGRRSAPVTGLDAVQRRVPFTIAAPDALAGRSRREVRLITADGKAGALVTYGQGLDGVAVLETSAGPAKPPALGAGSRDGLQLPAVSLGGGVSGQKLATALATAITFTRGDVTYVVVGSVTPVVAEAAARGLLG